MATKISIVIPNYNGKDLLAANIPQVIKNCKNCEIIVVDDGSSDSSVTFLHKKFKKVKVLRNMKNKGFAISANDGLRYAKSHLVLLLNTDVSPRPHFLEIAASHFKDSRIFAVGLADYSHEAEQTLIRGRGAVIFKKGLLKHFAAQIERGETFWVSGGSGLFDREKFLSIGGFDSLYAPFYWEDIDLAFRARKLGYKCIFEPLSKVDHYHEEGAIKKNFSPFFIKIVSYRNQLLFIWKNISDYMMISQHLVWLPYHFAKALVTLDLAFFFGFLWAVSKIPQLIFNDEPASQGERLADQLPDKQILSADEK